MLSTYPATTSLDFIKKQDLAIPEALASLKPDSTPKSPPNKKKSANVVAGSTVSFASDLQVLKKEDVLNSTLFAQLAANGYIKKQGGTRETDTQDWYAYYLNVLENIGWRLDSMQFQHYNTSSKTFTIDKAVIELLQALAAGEELTVLQATMDAFKKMDDGSRQVTIFDGSGSGGNNGNFQIGVASQEPGLLGNVTMVMGAYYFKAKVSKTKFLFWTWSSSEIDIYYDSHRISLNEEIYALNRAEIIKQLGDNAKTFIDSITLSPSIAGS